MFNLEFSTQELNSFIPSLRSRTGDISNLIHFSRVGEGVYNIYYTDNIKYVICKVGVKETGGLIPAFTLNLNDFQRLLSLETQPELTLVKKDDCFYCYLNESLIFMGDYEVEEQRFLPLPVVWKDLQGAKKCQIDRDMFLLSLNYVKKASKDSFIHMDTNTLSIREHDLNVSRELKINVDQPSCFHSSEIPFFKMFQKVDDLYTKVTESYLLFVNSDITRLLFVPNRRVDKAVDIQFEDSETQSYKVNERDVFNLIRTLSGFSEDAGFIQLIGEKSCLRARVKNVKFNRDSILTLSDEVTAYTGQKIYFFTILEHFLRVLGAFADAETLDLDVYDDGIHIQSVLGSASILNRNRGVWI